MSDAQERSEGYVHPSGQQALRHQNHEDDQEREHERHRRAQMVARAALCARTVGIAAYRGNIESTLPDDLPPEPAAAASDSIDGALVSAGELPEHSASNWSARHRQRSPAD